MKKMKFFQMSLFLLLLGMMSVNAQVHIGSDANPHLGAVLDLTNPNEQGLLLPNVRLTGVDVWQPVPGEAVDGMVVFTNGSGGLTSGMYVWSNGKWGLLSGSDVPGQGTGVAVIGVTVNPAIWNFTTSDTKTLVPTVAPVNATNKNLTWSSSDDNVATVSNNGIVTPVGNGYAIITVTTEDGNKTASCNVTVAYAVTGVSLNESTLTFTTTASQTLSATVAPDNADNKNVTWVSSNESIATVSENGVVTPHANGNAVITVTTIDGAKKATCDVTVAFAVTSVSLNKSTLSFTTNATQALSPTVVPAVANQNVTWSSDNSSVATVENGVVTPRGNGTALITVTTVEGNKQATCVVNVSFAITSITLSPASLNFTTTGTQTLTPTINPANAANKTLTWTSNKPSVATVANGVVTPIAGGITTIIATATDGSGKSANCPVTVVLPYLILNGAYSGPTNSELHGDNHGITMAQLTSNYGFSVSGNLRLYSQDLSAANWANAKTACTALGGGWRLPNIAELGNLAGNYASYGLSSGLYWSSTARGDTGAWYWVYIDGNTYWDPQSYTYNVRCVQTF